MKYNFYVKTASEVDISRIVNETPSDVDVIVLIGLGPDAVLLLRHTFLAIFNNGVDGLRIGDVRLESATGSFAITVKDGQGGVVIQPGNFSGGVNTTIAGIGWRSLGVPKADISKVIRQIAKAHAFVSRREVRVSYL